MKPKKFFYFLSNFFCEGVVDVFWEKWGEDLFRKLSGWKGEKIIFMKKGGEDFN